MTKSPNPTNHIGRTDVGLFPCLPNRAGKVNSFLRFSWTLRTSAITDSLHRQRTDVTTPHRDCDRHSPGGVHAFLRVQHLGRRMLFIRFVNRAVQAVRALVPEGRQQARDSGHSPFRGPARGRSPRARISTAWRLGIDTVIPMRVLETQGKGKNRRPPGSGLPRSRPTWSTDRLVGRYRVSTAWPQN